MKKRPPVPEVTCYLLPKEENNGVAQYAFWCPFCLKWHLHGAAAGAGNRAPHCHVDHSPFKETGYNLVCIGLVPNHLKTKTGDLKDIKRLRLKDEHVR